MQDGNSNLAVWTYHVTIGVASQARAIFVFFLVN